MSDAVAFASRAVALYLNSSGHVDPRCWPKPEHRPTPIPAGHLSYGILGCGGAVSSIPEPIAQTFARVPGKDAPNLFALIVGLHAAKKRKEGETEIAALACGPRVTVPFQLCRTAGMRPDRLTTSIASHSRCRAVKELRNLLFRG